jgi:parvulin-like peptidyl-prolyl isomerase
MALSAVAAASDASIAGSQTDDQPRQDGVFATVGGESITRETFDRYFASRIRQRFYHGKVTAAQRDAYREEVTQDLVDRVLLAQEARRREIIADGEFVRQQLRAYQQVAKGGPESDQIEALRERLEEDSRLEQLKTRVQDVPEPSSAAVLEFYQANPDKFTTPARAHVSLILLEVAPYAQNSQWQQALETGRALVQRIRDGEAFASLARENSTHESADRGGDLGMVHAGMLSREVQDVVDDMKPGEVSEPLVVLQGIAILQMHAKREPVLNPFEKVRERAHGLLVKQQQQQAWQALIERLRQETPVVMASGRRASAE